VAVNKNDFFYKEYQWLSKGKKTLVKAEGVFWLYPNLRRYQWKQGIHW